MTTQLQETTIIATDCFSVSAILSFTLGANKSSKSQFGSRENQIHRQNLTQKVNH